MSLVTKKCSQCQRDLPYFMFAANLKKADGMRSECRDCQKSCNARSRLKRKLQGKDKRPTVFRLHLD